MDIKCGGGDAEKIDGGLTGQSTTSTPQKFDSVSRQNSTAPGPVVCNTMELIPCNPWRSYHWPLKVISLIKWFHFCVWNWWYYTLHTCQIDSTYCCIWRNSYSMQCIVLLSFRTEYSESLTVNHCTSIQLSQQKFWLYNSLDNGSQVTVAVQ